MKSRKVFKHWIKPALDLKAISPKQARRMLKLVQGKVEATPHDLHLIEWVNLVNLPQELLLERRLPQ